MGSITAPPGSISGSSLTDNSVTDAKLRDSGPLSVIGRSANSTGDPADISATAASGQVLRESGSVLGFGTVAAAGLASDAVTTVKILDANVTTAKIADANVTYAKIQNVANKRVLGRNSSGSGVVEEVSASQMLNWLGTAAQGQILYRDASNWEMLNAGTSGQFLKTQGAAANPVWDWPTDHLIVAASDESTALTTGTAKVTFRMPNYATTLLEVYCDLVTAQASGSILTIDLNEAGTSVLSTKLTIDNTETDSATAATPPVISDSALAARAAMTVDIDQIGDGTAKGLKVMLVFKRA